MLYIDMGAKNIDHIRFCDLTDVMLENLEITEINIFLPPTSQLRFLNCFQNLPIKNCKCIEISDKKVLTF